MARDFVLFARTANPALAGAIAAEPGVAPGAFLVERFPDGETAIEVREPVRGREVVLVQPTAPPVNDHLDELLACADACRRAAARVTAVVPYLGYARSDKRRGRREPITASPVARMIQAAVVDHSVTFYLRAAQNEGFFRIPADTLTAVPTLCESLHDRLPAGAVVVLRDAGRVKTAADHARCLGTSVSVCTSGVRMAPRPM
jgi:ribose-phosphate pyrophosphokinase